MKISVFTLCPILDYFDKVIEDTEHKVNAEYFRNNVFGIPLFASTELDAIKEQIANYEEMEGVESSMSFTHLDARNVLVICKRYDTIINVYKIREFVVWNIRGLHIKPQVTPKDEDNGKITIIINHEYKSKVL